MTRWTNSTARLIMATAALAAPAGAQSYLSPDLAELDERIRIRIEASTGPAAAELRAVGERVHSAVALPRFYEDRAFQPVWLAGGVPGPLADSMVAAIRAAADDGLDPEDYHLELISTLVAELRAGGGGGAPVGDAATERARRLADLELLLTDAFLILGAHLVGGRVDPVTIHAEWNAVRREADMVAVLNDALATGRIGAAMQDLRPDHEGYYRLRAGLRRYRRIRDRGGWPSLSSQVLRSGMQGPAVAALRERLRLTGDLQAGVGAGATADTYDDELEAAVRRYQLRHGLDVDGVAGREVFNHLSIPIDELIRQIEVNLERWRWLPRDLGDRHIRVNIAGFDLQLIEGDSVVMRSRVMVGQRYRKTPVFSDRMTYLVFSPTWTIPPNILEVDKLPLIRQDPGYLARNRIRVLARDNNEVDPATVDWGRFRVATSPYRFEMAPGPENPLGQVKFMFPNPYHVYLHDTPSRDLFDQPRRAFSSGCIRVENPLLLAEHLLRDTPGWGRSAIQAAALETRPRTVNLRSPVAVHLLYWTAWADNEGNIHFRDDIYERDAALRIALDAPPPAEN